MDEYLSGWSTLKNIASKFVDHLYRFVVQRMIISSQQCCEDGSSNFFAGA
jgi:hypothetical protein